MRGQTGRADLASDGRGRNIEMFLKSIFFLKRIKIQQSSRFSSIACMHLLPSTHPLLPLRPKILNFSPLRHWVVKGLTLKAWKVLALAEAALREINFTWLFNLPPATLLQMHPSIFVGGIETRNWISCNRKKNLKIFWFKKLFGSSRRRRGFSWATF